MVVVLSLHILRALRALLAPSPALAPIPVRVARGGEPEQGDRPQPRRGTAT